MNKEERRRKHEENIRRANEWAERRAAAKAAKKSTKLRGETLPQSRITHEEELSLILAKTGPKTRREKLEEGMLRAKSWAEQRAANRADEEEAGNVVPFTGSGVLEGAKTPLTDDNRDENKGETRVSPKRSDTTTTDRCLTSIKETKEYGSAMKGGWLKTLVLRLAGIAAVSVLLCFGLISSGTNLSNLVAKPLFKESQVFKKINEVQCNSSPSVRADDGREAEGEEKTIDSTCSEIAGD